MKTEEKDKLSYALIGYAMAAHREIGPGLDESFYHQFMYERARADGLELLTKPRGQLMHRQRAIDLFECDLLVPQRLICELKVLRGAFAAEHYAQIFCYLKFWGIRVGLLFDFGKESLVYKRIVRDEIPLPAFSIEAFVSGAPPDQTDQACASLIARAISRILTEFGLGYRDTTYEALFCAELAAESIAFDFPAVVRVIAEREQLGEARLKCIALREGIAPFTPLSSTEVTPWRGRRPTRAAG